MIVNFSYLLVALSALFAVAAVPTTEPDEAPADLPADFPALPGIQVVDGRGRHPRQQSHYQPVDACPGSVVDSGDWGQFSWYLFYSPESHGTNCVIVRNRTGKRQNMSLSIRKDGGNWVNPDHGNFLYYAGPRQVTGTNGKCVHISFMVIWSHTSGAQLLIKNLACG